MHSCRHRLHRSPFSIELHFVICNINWQLTNTTLYDRVQDSRCAMPNDGTQIKLNSQPSETGDIYDCTYHYDKINRAIDGYIGLSIPTTDIDSEPGIGIHWSSHMLLHTTRGCRFSSQTNCTMWVCTAVGLARCRHELSLDWRSMR